MSHINLLSGNALESLSNWCMNIQISAISSLILKDFEFMTKKVLENEWDKHLTTRLIEEIGHQPVPSKHKQPFYCRSQRCVGVELAFGGISWLQDNQEWGLLKLLALIYPLGAFFSSFFKMWPILPKIQTKTTYISLSWVNYMCFVN